MRIPPFSEALDVPLTVGALSQRLFPDPSPGSRPVGTGFWVSNYRAAIQESQTLVATCREQACSRVLIQMPSLNDDEGIWREYARLLSLVQEAGIDVLALDGYPEAIQEPQLLADKIRRLLQLVRPGALSGVQLDIEPYLLPGFLDDDAQFRRYLGTIETMHEALQGRARLSMVIPFWLATPTVGGRPLAYAVMDRADEVAVMSYRTDLDEVQEIAEDILRYGDVIGKPVWLAVETTRLPVELEIRKSGRRSPLTSPMPTASKPKLANLKLPARILMAKWEY